MTESCPRCGARYPTGRIGACPLCLLEAEVPPAVLGGTYELHEEIGRGGMGSVYKARHRRLGHWVAVKLLTGELAAVPEFQTRFEREARALAMLSHPNIVTVHDFGNEGDVSYIVMEYIDGRPLSQLLPLPVPQAVQIAIQVCDALAFAHSKGIVHRDVKPENILVASDGRVKVSDFGIARMLGTDGRGWTVTTGDVVIGTPHYIAPEALSGAKPDVRMDIFSLGVVLYHVVTGRLPVGDFEPAPPPLDGIVRKALAPDPSKRYASVDEMRRDLLARGTVQEDLTPDEKMWMRAVAMLQSISTAVALWAFLACLTPKKIRKEDVMPLVHPWIEDLPDGMVLSRVRFEMWWSMAALVTFGIAITGYGLLRLHWRRAGLERPQPHRAVPESSMVLLFGLLSLGVYIVRRVLQSTGVDWPLFVIIGALILIIALFYLWVSILSAWRVSRPLYREPLMWLGFALAITPPVVELFRFLQTWKPV